jgi:hypothetical protein
MVTKYGICQSVDGSLKISTDHSDDPDICNKLVTITKLTVAGSFYRLASAPAATRPILQVVLA